MRRHRERIPGMKMQHDPSPMLPNALAQETVDRVRLALMRSVEVTGTEAAPDLRGALHALAREARTKDVTPEQLLVTLKGIWQSLPDIENARDYNERNLILQRVVTVCIKEYFAD